MYRIFKRGQMLELPSLCSDLGIRVYRGTQHKGRQAKIDVDLLYFRSHATVTTRHSFTRYPFKFERRLRLLLGAALRFASLLMLGYRFNLGMRFSSEWRLRLKFFALRLGLR